MGGNPVPFQEADSLGSEFVPCADTPLQFITARPHSTLALGLPNSIYVSLDGTIRARFEFADEGMHLLTKIHVSDRFGRPWIGVSVNGGEISHTRFLDDRPTSEAEVTLADHNADGTPDSMVDWTSNERFKRVEEIVWQRVETRREQRRENPAPLPP